MFKMVGTSNAEADQDSSSTFSAFTQDESSNGSSDDAFLAIQRATSTVGKICNEFSALSRADFFSCLSECCNCYELRYVRDMMVSIVKRKVKQSVGPLVEHKGGSNLKDNLLKDVYNLYSFGEGSVQSLPKNMIKCDTKYVNQSTETDAYLSNTIFASKLDFDTVKDKLINRILDSRHEMLNTDLLSRSPIPIMLLSSHSQSTIPDTLSSTQSQSTSQSEDSQLPSQSSQFVTQPVSPSATLRNTNREPDEANDALNSNYNDDQPKTNLKIVIAGDSLLHRINSRKMMVNKIPSVKLTKRGDNLSGTVSRLTTYISKHSNILLDIVLMQACTNDLSKCDVTPEGSNQGT